MYVQIEPAQFPERYQTVAARAAALMSKIAGIAPDEHGSVEGFTDDDVEARLVSDLLDVVCDGEVRPEFRQFLADVLHQLEADAQPLES